VDATSRGRRRDRPLSTRAVPLAARPLRRPRHVPAREGCGSEASSARSLADAGQRAERVSSAVLGTPL